MESHNLTTRTYTALTCELIVVKQDKQQFGLEPNFSSQPQDRHHPVDFILNLDDPDREELAPVTLEGQFHQLDLLQQVVNQYITALIAKFPLPTMNNSTSDHGRSTTADRDLHESTPASPPDRSISSKLYPNSDDESTTAGLLNNLPGLRNNLAQSAATNEPTPRSNSTAGLGISKFFGGWNKRSHDKNWRSSESKQHTPLDASSAVTSGFGKREVENLAASQSEQDATPTTPYLTGSDRSLDRQLHLGDLATETSGEVVTLSPIQLFDLSTVLDEYAADEAATSTEQAPSAVFSRVNIPGDRDRLPADETTTALSRLPNLPRASSSSQTSQVFNRTRQTNYGPQFSFMSVVPWAAAAAVAVGIPLLLLDPKPNPLKDATSKVKMPDLEGVKKTVTDALAPTVADPEPTTNTAGTNLPKPWQEQAVQPPQTGRIAGNLGTKLPQAGTTLPDRTQPPQSIGKIGIAPLPTTLVGKPGQDLPIAGMPSDNHQPLPSTLPSQAAPSDIAPNPLSSPGVDSMGAPKLSPAAKSVLKAAQTSPAKTSGVQSRNGAETVPPMLGSTTNPILPPLNLPGIGVKSANSSQPQLSPVQIEPISTTPPTTTKTTKPKANPKVAAKTPQPKPAKSTGIPPVRQPLFEPFAPNPNFIDLAPPQANVPNSEFQNLPPADPVFPTSTDGNWAGNSIESPSLQESKRYFQAKWKANNTQANALQYVVQIGGKNGLIKGIAPQGEAAKTYLQTSKFAKVGQKLVSPAAAGSTDQKIRVILQPDGNVDTFIEPQQ
jgi:hypothetical protein